MNRSSVWYIKIIAAINSWVKCGNRVSVNRNGDKAFQTGTVLTKKKRKLMHINVRWKTLKPEWVLHTYSHNTERGCCLSWSWKILSNRASFTQNLISWYSWYRSVCMETRHGDTVDGHCQVGKYMYRDGWCFRLMDTVLHLLGVKFFCHIAEVLLNCVMVSWDKAHCHLQIV